MKYDSLIGFNGINRSVSPFLTEVGGLSETQNFSAEKIGVLKKSFDYTIKGAQTVDYNVLGGIDFFRNDGTHDHVIAVSGAVTGDFYLYDTSWVAQSQGINKDNKVSFSYSPTLDTLFACNYADATRSFNGSAWSTTTNVTSAPKAKFTISFGERIYLLNCVVGATSYPSRAYRSNAIETSATWDTTNDYIVFNDTITGVGLNGGNMFVGCQNSTHIFTLSDGKFQVSSIGCTSNEGIVQSSKYTFYPSNDGYYCFDGTDTFKISTPIQDYWKKIPDANLSSIQSVTLGDHVYVYIGDISAPWDSSETLKNVIFDYNILQNNWHRGRLSTPCTNLHTYVTELGRKIFMGDDSGKVYQMFDDTGQQNGADYESSFETNWLYGSGAGTLDDFQEFWGYGEYLSGLKVSYKTEEREDWTPIGELNSDSQALSFKKRAYKIKFRLAEFSGKNLFEVERIDVGYMPAFERGTNEDRKG